MRSAGKGGGRRGYTLLETMLVMSLLVMLAAIVVANVTALPDVYRLERTADDLRGILAGVRSRAMHDGVAVEFSFSDEAESYRVKRAGETANGSANANSAQGPRADTEMEGSEAIEFDRDEVFGEHQLPEGVTLRQTSAWKSGKRDQNGFGGEANRVGTRFLPDGTCNSLQFLLDDGIGAYRVELRGLTGGVVLTRLSAEERSQER